jgi:hypothetical protein
MVEFGKLDSIRQASEVLNMAIIRNARQKIFLIKLVHTATLVLFSSCIVYIFYSAITGTYSWILLLAIGTILAEGLVLLLNNWQCPLTNLARGLGDETGRVTDIFFPAWFVPHVFRTCTALYIIGVALIVINFIVGRF